MLMDRYTFPTADAWGIFDDGLEPVDEDGIIAENVRLVEQYINFSMSVQKIRQERHLSLYLAPFLFEN